MPNRTIAVPIAEIIDGGTKSEFYAELRSMLDLCRRAANKSVAMCLAADTELMTGGKCPKLYNYKVIAGDFPGLSAVAGSIDRSVSGKYRQERYRVSSGAMVSTYGSFPLPLIHNVSHSTMTVDFAKEFITVRLKLMKWWAVRIAGGSSHRTQIDGIRNATKVGDSKIWIDRKHKAIIGFAVTVGENQVANVSGVLHVASSRDSLLIASRERDITPFVLTGDVAKQIVAIRETRQQRLSCDRKSGSKRAAIKKLQTEVSEKSQRRMKSFLHETSSHLVQHAVRRKVETLHLDLTVKSFIKPFPWFELASMIRYKCEDEGIKFIESTQKVTEPDVERPHVYFKFSPSTNRVKIGRTRRNDGGRHGSETDSPEELVILAVDNQPIAKLVQREKYFHSQFANWKEKGEWFRSGPVIEWLREVGWIGNAGNISQIAQVLDV